MKKLFFLFIFLFIQYFAFESIFAQKNQNLFKAPEISLDAIYNKADRDIPTLKSLRGKIVVLDFWATWCSPCIAAIPNLNKLSEEYAEKIQFIGITDDSKNKVENFLKKREIKYWIGIDSDKSDFENYNVVGLPTIIIINSNGYIIYRGSRVDNQLLDMVLKTDTVFPENKKSGHIKNITVHDVYGTWSPGEDPLYNGVDKLLNESKKRSEPIFQFIIRPSLLNKSEGRGFGVKHLDGITGITINNEDIRDIIVFLYDLPSKLWVNDLTNNGTRYDIIYHKKHISINEAFEEIKKTLINYLFLKINERNQEKDVNLLFLKNEHSQGVFSKKQIKRGTQKLYISIGDFASILEDKTGQIYLSDENLKNKYLYNKLAYNINRFSYVELINFLKDAGIEIKTEKRKLKIIEIK